MHLVSALEVSAWSLHIPKEYYMLRLHVMSFVINSGEDGHWITLSTTSWCCRVTGWLLVCSVPDMHEFICIQHFLMLKAGAEMVARWSRIGSGGRSQIFSSFPIPSQVPRTCCANTMLGYFTTLNRRTFLESRGHWFHLQVCVMTLEYISVSFF